MVLRWGNNQIGREASRRADAMLDLLGPEQEGQSTAHSAVGRREAARGHRPGPDQGTAPSASPTSRPPPSTGSTANRSSNCCGPRPTTTASTDPGRRPRLPHHSSLRSRFSPGGRMSNGRHRTAAGSEGQRRQTVGDGQLLMSPLSRMPKEPVMSSGPERRSLRPFWIAGIATFVGSLIGAGFIFNSVQGSAPNGHRRYCYSARA